MATDRRSPSTEQRSLGADVTTAEPTAAADDVLVYNSRKGIYQAYAAREVTEHSSERQRRMQVDPLLCYPGLTLVSRKLWERLEGQPGLRERIASDEIREIVDFGALSEKTAVGYVRDSAHLPTLRRLLQVERRDAVEQALRTQVDAGSRDASPRGQAPTQGAMLR